MASAQHHVNFLLAGGILGLVQGIYHSPVSAAQDDHQPGWGLQDQRQVVQQFVRFPAVSSFDKEVGSICSKSVVMGTSPVVMMLSVNFTGSVAE